jgi:hypothetical protein
MQVSRCDEGVVVRDLVCPDLEELAPLDRLHPQVAVHADPGTGPELAVDPVRVLAEQLDVEPVLVRAGPTVAS